MKLHQLRYLVAVADSDLNITAASNHLHTSQPGVSKQLRLLESELGFKIFSRRGRALTRVTPAGDQVVKRAQRVLDEIESIRRLSDDLSDQTAGTLAIGTTHTQARYVLPAIIGRFRERYPGVKLQLHQGTTEQIADMVLADQIDLAIATGSENLFPEMTILPGYHWHRTVVVPRGHPLAETRPLSLRALAAHPLISYAFGLSGPLSLLATFAEAGLEPDVVLTAGDSDVIKTYVRLGLGIGILAHMAVNPVEDADLVPIDATALFPCQTTWIGFRRGLFIKNYTYDFLQLFAPHLERRRVDSAIEARSHKELAAVYSGVTLQVR